MRRVGDKARSSQGSIVVGVSVKVTVAVTVMVTVTVTVRTSLAW